MITGARWVTSASGAAVFALAILIAIAGVLATQRQTSAADPVGIYVAADSLVAGRSDHTATLLDDGTVFIAGGLASGTPLGSTEIYDPATDSTTAGPTLSEPRTAHRAPRDAADRWPRTDHGRLHDRVCSSGFGRPLRSWPGDYHADGGDEYVASESDGDIAAEWGCAGGRRVLDRRPDGYGGAVRPGRGKLDGDGIVGGVPRGRVGGSAG